jgi:hypothetical protein
LFEKNALRRVIDHVEHDRILRERSKIECLMRRRSIDHKIGPRQGRVRRGVSVQSEIAQQFHASIDGSIYQSDVPRRVGLEDPSGGPGRSAGADQDDLHVLPNQVVERPRHAVNIAIPAVKAAVLTSTDGIDGANPARFARHAIQQRHDPLLVGHRQIAAAPVWIGAAQAEIIFQLVDAHANGAIGAFDAELVQPIFVDRRRFGMGDGVADHLGIGNAHQPSSRPRSRR